VNLTVPTIREAKRLRWIQTDAEARPARISKLALIHEVAIMRADPSAEFRTESAAARHGVTSSLFIRAFKKLTGISPQRFHAALRIERAKHLLIDTTRSVTDISFDVGYNSLGTFVRTFTLLVGLSPTQLRHFARGENVELAIFDVPMARIEQIRPGLRAAIVNPPADRLLAAGLFPQSLPAGLPFDGCFIDPACGCFELRWATSRENANLLAASVSLDSIQDAWAGRFGSINVCSRRVSREEADHVRSIQLHLRPLAETDPPFLTPVPLLLILQSRQEAAAA